MVVAAARCRKARWRWGCRWYQWGGGTLCATEARLATTNTTQRNGGCRDVGMAVWVAPSLGRGRPRLLQAAAGRPGRAIMRLFSRNSSSIDAHVDDGVVPLRLSPPVP